MKTTQDRWQLLQVAQPVQLEAGRWFCEVDMAGTSGQPVKEFMVDMDPANSLTFVVVMLLTPNLRDILSNLGVTSSFEIHSSGGAQTPKRGTDAEDAACTPHADLILQSMNSGMLLRLPISGKACRVPVIEAADSDATSDIEGPALSLSSSTFNIDVPSQCVRVNKVHSEPLHNTPLCKNDKTDANQIEEIDIGTNVLSVADTARKPLAEEGQHGESHSGYQKSKVLSAWAEQLESPVGTCSLPSRLIFLLLILF